MAIFFITDIDTHVVAYTCYIDIQWSCGGDPRCERDVQEWIVGGPRCSRVDSGGSKEREQGWEGNQGVEEPQGGEQHQHLGATSFNTILYLKSEP